MRCEKILVLTLIGGLLAGCIESFVAETQSFEDVLVIDGLLTTEEKKHQVRLSRSYAFEEEEASAESGAQVRIQDDLGNTYDLSEITPGVYETISAFGAVPGLNYQLQITTADGREYSSTNIKAPDAVPIESLIADRDRNDLGVEGVRILLNNKSEAGDPAYFRYEYEETYKIIAPDWNPFEFDIIDDVACADGDAFEVGIKRRTEEARVCFGTGQSIEPLQASTVGLTENEISNLLVRFLDRDNYIISHRYSILVRQYTQTAEAHAFYQDLLNFSSSEEVFTQIQPGFFEGNVNAKNSNTRVLGYFEVAAVSERRLYFNYEDLFPDEPLPPYAINCSPIFAPSLISFGYHCDGPICDGACDSPLINGIKAGLIAYIGVNDYVNDPFFRELGPYLTKASPCVDCRKLGSNIIPDFWEE